MKRVVIAAISAVLAVTVACIGYWQFLRICDRLETDARSLLETAEAENIDESQLEAETNRLIENWHGAQKKLDMLIPHEQTDELDILIRALPQLPSLESTAARSEYLREILYRIEHLRETEAPNLQNIL